MVALIRAQIGRPRVGEQGAPGACRRDRSLHSLQPELRRTRDARAPHHLRDQPRRRTRAALRGRHARASRRGATMRRRRWRTGRVESGRDAGQARAHRDPARARRGAWRPDQARAEDAESRDARTSDRRPRGVPQARGRRRAPRHRGNPGAPRGAAARPGRGRNGRDASGRRLLPRPSSCTEAAWLPAAERRDYRGRSTRRCGGGPPRDRPRRRRRPHDGRTHRVAARPPP